MIIQRTAVKVKDKLETYEGKNYFRVYCMYIMHHFRYRTLNFEGGKYLEDGVCYETEGYERLKHALESW